MGCLLCAHQCVRAGNVSVNNIHSECGRKSTGALLIAPGGSRIGFPFRGPASDLSIFILRSETKNNENHKSEGCPTANTLLGREEAGQYFPWNEGSPNGQSLLKLSIPCLSPEFTVNCLGWLSLHPSFQDPQ